MSKATPSPSPATPAAPGSETAAAPSGNLASYCPPLKYAYENCFQRWYTQEFLPGHSETLPCQKEYSEYQKCVLDSMKAVGLHDILPQIDEARPGVLHFTEESKKK